MIKSRHDVLFPGAGGGSDDESDKESAVGELIADIFGSSDEDEEFEGFGAADVEAPAKKDKKKTGEYKNFIVPRRNEVAEGGYWITLRPSVRPSVRPFPLNNFKSFGQS